MNDDWHTIWFNHNAVGSKRARFFWAAFRYGVRTSLVPMEGDPTAPRGGVTARVYQAVLDQYLPPILGFGNIFMQDNAPIYKAYIIRDWYNGLASL